MRQFLDLIFLKMNTKYIQPRTKQGFNGLVLTGYFRKEPNPFGQDRMVRRSWFWDCWVWFLSIRHRMMTLSLMIFSIIISEKWNIWNRVILWFSSPWTEYSFNLFTGLTDFTKIFSKNGKIWTKRPFSFNSLTDQFRQFSYSNHSKYTGFHLKKAVYFHL